MALEEIAAILARKGRRPPAVVVAAIRPGHPDLDPRPADRLAVRGRFYLALEPQPDLFIGEYRHLKNTPFLKNFKL
jgi:hypothetical protein